MSTLGVSPTTFNLLKGYGTTGTVDFNSANNMITLLSYIDITRGWEWLHALHRLQADIEGSTFSGNVQIIAVVFNRYYSDPTVKETWGIDTFSGNISREWIEGKIDYDTALSGINFTVLVDSIWTGPSPAAINIIDDYSGPITSPLPDLGTFWFAGLVDKNFRVSDKWEYNTTPSSRVTSFDHIAGTGFTSFQSNDAADDYANARAFIMKRIKNLIDPLYIIDTKPVSGASVNTLNQSKIYFSKPVNSAEAQNVNNYTLNGGGFTGAEHPSIVNHPGSNAENASTLTILDTLSDAVPAVTITVTGLHDTTPATATPPGPLPIVTAGGANVLNLIADITPPSVSINTTDGAYTTSDTVNYTLSGSDVNKVKSWAVVVQAASLPAPDPADSAYTDVAPVVDFSRTSTVTLTGGEIKYRVYGFLKDVAGNKNSAYFEVTSDKTAPTGVIISSADTFPVTGPIHFNIKGTDVNGVTGWLVSEKSEKPLLTDAGWHAIASLPASGVDGTYAPQVSGYRNLYVWLRDAAGNISDLASNSYLTFIFQSNPWTGVLARDHVGDAGNVPSVGTLSQSLDIIINTTAVTDPNVSFPVYNSGYGDAPHPLIKGTSYYLYVRAKNCGSSNIAAGDAKAYLYYSPSNVFGTPSIWINNSIFVNGSTTQKDNPMKAMGAGAVGFEQQAFKWTPAVDAGHYCFIGIISTDKHPWDPVNPPKFPTPAHFSLFVASSPNICWRNYDVANAVSSGKSYISRNKIVNEWRRMFHAMIAVTVRNVPVKTVVTIKNADLGINITHEVQHENEVVWTGAVPLASGKNATIETRVILPDGVPRFQAEAQIETAAYMAVHSLAIAKTSALVDFGEAKRLPHIKAALAVARDRGEFLNERDQGGPAGYVKIGSYTTIFTEPGLKKTLVPDIRPVRTSIEYVVPGKVIPVKPSGLRGDVVGHASVTPGKKPVKTAPGSGPKAKVDAKTRIKSAVKAKPEPEVKAKTKAKPAAKAKPEAKAKTVKKKTVTKKAAVKKPVVKKATVKKTVTKKAAVKKAAVKKIVKKVVARKTTIKKAAAGKPVNKKSAVKKTAVKKPVVKKAAVKKAAPKKPAVKKTSVKKLFNKDKKK